MFEDKYFKIVKNGKRINALLEKSDAIIKDIIAYMKLLQPDLDNIVHYNNSIVFNDIFMQLVLKDIMVQIDLDVNTNYLVSTKLNDDKHWYAVANVSNKEIGKGYTIAKTLIKV